MTGAKSSTTLPLVDETLDATQRYLEALTVLDERSARRPSVLPGWSRAHVVAHLSRNADAFTRVLRQVEAGEPASMYDDTESRDRDIEETVATLDLPALLDDAHRSAERLETALLSCRADRSTPMSRVPGAAATSLGTLPPFRRAEVEIHHADLDIGYSPADWPTDFSVAMVKQRQDEMAANPGGGVSMVLSSTDAPGLWKFGEGQGPEVQGTAGDLVWWLVGRGDGRGLTSSTGELPALGRWR